MTSEGSQEIFSKVTYLKSVHSKEKDEACLSFLVKFFTKSLHRGGVGGLYLDGKKMLAPLNLEIELNKEFDYGQIFK